MNLNLFVLVIGLASATSLISEEVFSKECTLLKKEDFEKKAVTFTYTNRTDKSTETKNVYYLKNTPAMQTSALIKIEPFLLTKFEPCSAH